MSREQVRRLPVVDPDNRLVGMLSLANLAREAARERGSPRATSRSARSAAPWRRSPERTERVPGCPSLSRERAPEAGERFLGRSDIP